MRVVSAYKQYHLCYFVYIISIRVFFLLSNKQRHACCYGHILQMQVLVGYYDRISSELRVPSIETE